MCNCAMPLYIHIPLHNCCMHLCVQEKTGLKFDLLFSKIQDLSGYLKCLYKLRAVPAETVKEAGLS